MLRLIRLLLTGSWHSHKWAVIKIGTIGNQYHRYHLQCKVCGTVKSKEI